MGNKIQGKKIVALIPARGGSKRIGSKNILPLPHLGHPSIVKPMLTFTIDAAQGVQEIQETWVSTDDANIAKCAKSRNANVIERPKELSSDTASSESALLHFAENVDFDILVFIQGTSPLLTSGDIQKGLDLYAASDFDSVFSVVRENGFFWTHDGKPVNYDPMNRPRSQEKVPWFKENGAFYITSKTQLQKSRCRFSGRIGYTEMALTNSFEIDSWEDVHLVSALLEAKAFVEK